MKLGKGSVLVIASHNKGKIPELQELLSEYALDIKSAADFNVPEPEETALTFEGNALLKARNATKATGLPSISDDSGLCVTALDGAPGIYSARLAGAAKDFNVGMACIEEALREVKATDFSAKFVCALALRAPDGREEVFRGEAHGRLVFPPRGSNGFGYDPIFVAQGMNETYGEIASKLKDAVNHRAKAFEKLKASLRVI